MTGRSDPLVTSGLLVGLLSAASGIVDAYGFLTWQVFVANQTGNLVIVAMHLVGAGFPDAVSWSVVALLGFIAGVAGTWALRTRIRRAPAPNGTLLWAQAVVMVVVAGLVVAGAAPLLIIAVAAATQGIQGVALTRVLDIAVRTVVVTGAILDVARYWSGRRRDRAMLAATAPLGYALGAVAGAVAAQRAGAIAVLTAAIAVAVAAVLVGQLARRPDVVA